MSVDSTASVYWRLSSFYFVYYLVLGTMMPFWSLYLDARGLSATDIAGVFAVMSVTRIVGPNIWGWLADRSGRRLQLIRMAAVGAAVSFAGVLLVRDGPGIAVVICLHTLLWNGILAQYEAISLAALGGSTARYGRVRLWGSVSFICAVWGFGWLFDQIALLYFPWLMIVLLTAVAASTFGIRDAGAGRTREAGRGLGEILRRPDVLAFLLACFLMQVSHGAYYTFFSLHVADLGYSRAEIGFLWAVGVIAEIIVFAMMHRLRLRFDMRTLLLLSIAAAVLRWLMTAWLSHSPGWLLLAQTLHAFTYGSFHVAGIEFVLRQFGWAHQGQGQALYSAVSFGAGAAVGALISGAIWVQGATLAFLFSAAVAVVCWLIVALWVREDAHHEGEPTGSVA